MQSLTISQLAHWKTHEKAAFESFRTDGHAIVRERMFTRNR